MTELEQRAQKVERQLALAGYEWSVAPNSDGRILCLRGSIGPIIVTIYENPDGWRVRLATQGRTKRKRLSNIGDAMEAAEVLAIEQLDRQ